MKRIIVWIASTIASLVLLFGYPTSTLGPAASAQAGPAIPGMDATATPPPTSAGNGSTETSPLPTTGKSTASPKGPEPARSYTGGAVATVYGPVQVQITASAGSVTNVQVLQVPWSNATDKQINGWAVPQLNSQVVDGDATDVHTVSGASYTSAAYIDSLQSALDQANL